jgi:hypothetical protein
MSLLSFFSSTSPSASPHAKAAVALVVAGMLAVVACAKPNEEPMSQTTRTSASVRALASCDTTAEAGSCTDYSSASGSFQLERSLCRSARGGFALAACPSAGRIGACLIEESEVKRYYAGEHGFTAETARADCEQNGVKGRFLPDARGASRGLAAR